MNKKDFCLALDGIRSNLLELSRDSGVSYDSSLYAYLHSACYLIDMASLRLNQFNGSDDE